MSRRTWVVMVAVPLAVGVGCGIAIRRDLSNIPPGQVGFDDMCGLQEYFDALEIKTSPPPRVVSALDLEGESGGKPVRGGRERFAFDNDFLMKTVKRVLRDNWRGLPDELERANEVEIEVRWSEKAATKRVVTNGTSELYIGRQSWSLPYHPCLSELLYGEPLYRQRRQLWGLPLPGAQPDGGSPDAGLPAAAPAPHAAADAGRRD
jgi:hypothetical protein